MNTRAFRLALALAAALGLGGCAYLFLGPSQAVTVKTECPQHVLRSVCTASIGLRSWRFETPARLVVPRTSESMRITCDSGLVGGGGETVRAGPSLGVLGNAVAGGLVGVVVDVQSNRAFAYPDVVNVEMPVCAYLKKGR